MAIFRPFKAVRPTPELAKDVAALPYDVMNSEEAREMVKGNPVSFLHIDRAEIDLPEGTDPYSAQVYQKAAETMNARIADGTYITDDEPCYYIYRLTMNGRSQAGIVGCASIDDYMNGTIKKHELTVEAKEQDRIRHVDALDANTGIIFLTFRGSETIENAMKTIMAHETPIYDFTEEDGIRHEVWKVDASRDEELQSAFAAVPCLYTADGHHRAASAVKVGMKRRKEAGSWTGNEEFNFFLAAAFPSSELAIWDYNRYVHDLNGLTEQEFMDRIGTYFEVRKFDAQPDGSSEKALAAVKPKEKHTFSMYMSGTWYGLKAKPAAYDEADVVSQLDVTILQNRLLAPVLGIGDPRTDGRISFVGGIRGLAELVRLTDNGGGVAFAMYPTTLDDLMRIADEGKIMPPKSTWFEPKLRSGLLIHRLG